MMANKLAAVAAWLNATETPRWAIAAGGVIMAGLTLLGTYAVESRISDQQARAAEIDVLRSSMVDFQVFASAFATEMLTENKVSTNTRSRLIENLNQQFALIRQLDDDVSREAVTELDNYKKTVLQMAEAVNKTTDVLSMAEFWSVASDLTLAKNRLNQRLQQVS